MDSRRLYDDLALAEQDNSLDIEPSAVGEADDEDEEREQPLNRDVAPPWQPSGNFWTDAWHFVGPGWLVSIAYVDPGNYQADISAGGTTRYRLLFAIWWSSLLSIYVQVLCVRLAYHTQLTLAEAQARDCTTKWQRYRSWFIAELSTMITDLPEVIGIGIACHYFFGWDYYVGVLLSLVTTMLFLGTQRFGMQTLEWIVFAFVGILSIALWMEMAFIGPDRRELVKGWTYGFVDVTSEDMFSIAGILGSVVMPHNLYLHTAAVQSRRVERRENVVKQAVMFSSWEPVVPIFVSFFVNMAVVSIAAESVYGVVGAEGVGLTDFCSYFQSLKGGCIMWGIALLAAGQSSAITTTYTGQYVMDGFLTLQLPLHLRAIVTRLFAIAPCVVVSVLFPTRLNDLINMVNAALSFLLPFAFTPLVKYNCSEQVMGKFASRGLEKYTLFAFAILVWMINAVTLSLPGGGFFGEFVPNMPWGLVKLFWIGVQVALQVAYGYWNLTTLFSTASFAPQALGDEGSVEVQFARSIT